MDNFDLRKYLAEGKLLKENKYDIDDPNSPLGQLNDNDQDVAILNNMTKKYGKDVVLMWMSSGEYGDREYFEEGKLLKEEKGINYLKDAFETYLAGGDTFTNKPGKTETVKFKNDGSLIPKNKFEVALQSLPTTVKVDVYNVNFKKVGDNIVGTFKIK